MRFNDVLFARRIVSCQESASAPHRVCILNLPGIIRKYPQLSPLTHSFCAQDANDSVQNYFDR